MQRRRWSFDDVGAAELEKLPLRFLDHKFAPEPNYPGPWAQRFVEFQEALGGFRQAATSLEEAHGTKWVDGLREGVHQAEAKVLRLYNEVLTLAQRLIEHNPAPSDAEDKHHEFDTYYSLLYFLASQPSEVLKQTPSCIGAEKNKAGEILLQPVFAIGTVAEMCGEEKTRGHVDWQHHPEQLVLLTDGHPFGEDGCIAHDLMTGMKIYPIGHPKYQG
jgi:hypothetical protein